jgi:hypothetical protein
VALDSSAQITPRKTPQRRALAEDDRSSQPLEERLVLIEQRIKNEVLKNGVLPDAFLGICVFLFR